MVARTPIACSSLPVRRVSSATTRFTAPRVSRARSLRSPRFPIGVATTYSTPAAMPEMVARREEARLSRMTQSDTDYSGTPLWKKLGIAEGSRVRVLDAPDGFDAALTTIAPLPDGVTFLARTGRDLDVIVAFVLRVSQLRRRFVPLARAIAPAGRLW